MLVIKQFGPVTYAMGTLQEILAGTGIAAKVRALPNDVAGCTLEMGVDGLWTGSLGTLTQEQADALVALGLMANVKAGTPGNVNGSAVAWRNGAWVVAAYDPGSKVAFDFSATPDGGLPERDHYGQAFSLYVPPNAFASGSVIDGGYARTDVSGASVARGFYLDTKKHENDISEAGATVKFDAAGITFALVLWKDYTSVIFPTNVLTGAAHIRFTTTSVSYDVWDNAGVITTLATSTFTIATGVDHKFLAKFSGSTAQIFVNGLLVLTVSDSRIATLGRKVACFEPYQNANVVGYVRIKSGFAKSPFAGDGENLIYPLATRKQKANASQITVSTSFVDLVDSLATPHKTVMAILKFPFAQTVAGELYIDFYATSPAGVNIHNIVTANRDVRTGIATVMAHVPEVNGGSVKAQIARDASAAATIPISTYLDHPEMILIPIQ